MPKGRRSVASNEDIDVVGAELGDCVGVSEKVVAGYWWVAGEE